MIPRIRSHLALARFTFAGCWRSARALTLAYIVVPVVQALLPAALVLSIRGLVDELVRLQHRGSGGTGSIGKWILLGLVVAVTSGLLAAVATYVEVTLAELLDEHISVEIMTHANRLDYAVFEDREFQNTLTHINEQPADHMQNFVGGAVGIIAAAVRIATLLAILLAIEPLLLLALAPLAIPYLLFFAWVSKKRYEESRSQLTKRRWVKYYIGQLTSASALAEIRVLDLGTVFINRTKAILRDVQRRNLRFHRLQLAGTALFVAASIGAIYVALFSASKDVLAGRLTVGDIAIFGATALSLRTAVDSLINVTASFRWHTLHVTELATFLALPHRADTATLSPSFTRRGQLDLEHVSFTYPGTKRQILRDVNLHIAPGETVAIVGENGSGKSTLVKLIAGLYAPERGRVLLDGVDVSTIATKDLADQVSFVVQEFGRYAATVGENIAFGDWSEMLGSPDKIRGVIDEVGIGELIDQMPDGVDTLLGRQFGTYEPSGGQWQQIAIARAQCRHAVVQILDEPTSNLDVKTEYALFSKFSDLAAGRTTLLISHRFSTVSLADRIVVMHEGQIVDDGTHAELVAKDGMYAHLYRLHRRERDEAVPDGDGR